MSGRLVGCMVSTSFGMVFLLVNSAHLPGRARVVVIGVAALAAAVIVACAVRRRHELGAASSREDRDPFRGRFPVIVGTEVLLLFGGLAVLGRGFGLQDAGVAWVATVVGAHFAPMGWASGMRLFSVLAALITPLGLIGLALTISGRPLWSVELVSGVGSGLVLLGAAVWGLTGGLTRDLHAAGHTMPAGAPHAQRTRTR